MGMDVVSARLFAAAGAKVLVADLNAQGGGNTVSDIESAGGAATFHQVDISDPVQVRDMVAAAVEAYGRLDVAVNNAALIGDRSGAQPGVAGLLDEVSEPGGDVAAGAVHRLGRPPLAVGLGVDTHVHAQLPAVRAPLPK